MGDAESEKGLISFAAPKCRGAKEFRFAAKVVRPWNELDRNRTPGYGEAMLRLTEVLGETVTVVVAVVVVRPDSAGARRRDPWAGPAEGGFAGEGGPLGTTAAQLGRTSSAGGR